MCRKIQDYLCCFLIWLVYLINFMKVNSSTVCILFVAVIFSNGTRCIHDGIYTFPDIIHIKVHTGLVSAILNLIELTFARYQAY